eukprot:123828_1
MATPTPKQSHIMLWQIKTIASNISYMLKFGINAIPTLCRAAIYYMVIYKAYMDLLFSLTSSICTFVCFLPIFLHPLQGLGGLPSFKWEFILFYICFFFFFFFFCCFFFFFF